MTQRFYVAAHAAPRTELKLSFNSVNKEKIVAITRDEIGIAEVLRNQFQQLGYQVNLVTYLPPICHIAIVLDALKSFSTVTEAIQINHKVFTQARIVAPHFANVGGSFITVQDLGGKFGLTNTDEKKAYSAGLTGLIKTAAQEWPKVQCKAIDIECKTQSVNTIADRLIQEILSNDGQVECGLLANGDRITLKTYPQSTSISPLTLSHESVIVVSGGARGITASCIIELAKQTHCRFALLGRTILQEEPELYKKFETEKELRQEIYKNLISQNLVATPKQIQQETNKILAIRETLRTISILKNAGAIVSYFSVDIQNQDAVSKTFDEIRTQLGPITGIIHGAGVLADKLISQKTDQQFHSVFNTKVVGLQNLLKASEKDALKTLILFSSVAGRFGNIGQCDYAMANEVLNKIAQYEQQRRGKECVVKSINWGPWESGMVTPQLKELFAKKGIAVLPVRQGVKIFIDELKESLHGPEVVVGGSLTGDILFEASVSEKTYPMLNSHIVSKVPVLAACLVLEWFTQAAKELFPNHEKYVFRDFKVLKGIQLNHFYIQPEKFLIQYKKNSEGYLLQLLKIDNLIPYYSMQVVENVKDVIHPEFTVEKPDKSGWPWDLDDIYFDARFANNSGRLFHGPDFQTISALDFVVDEGGSGKLKGVYSKPWPGQWAIDALAVDGLLQLGRLWVKRMFNKPTLPTQIKEIILYDKLPSRQELQCEFHCWTSGRYSGKGDFFLLKKDGTPYLSMRSAETCVVPVAVREI